MHVYTYICVYESTYVCVRIGVSTYTFKCSYMYACDYFVQLIQMLQVNLLRHLLKKDEHKQISHISTFATYELQGKFYLLLIPYGKTLVSLAK